MISEPVSQSVSQSARDRDIETRHSLSPADRYVPGRLMVSWRPGHPNPTTAFGLERAIPQDWAWRTQQGREGPIGNVGMQESVSPF